MIAAMLDPAFNGFDLLALLAFGAVVTRQVAKR